jgi:hypothetical protein
VVNLTNPKYDKVKIDGKDQFSQMRPQVFVIGGYHYQVDDVWAVRPELLLRYVATTPLSMNIGVHGHYMNRYSFGINFLTGQPGLSFCVRGKITDEISMGYSYDVFFGAMKSVQSGSHEITVGYLMKRTEY